MEPCIVLGEDGDFLDVVPLKLKRYEGFKTQVYDSFNRALDEFYLRVTVAERAIDHVEVDKLKKEAERLRRMVADQEKSINEDQAKAERDKLIGDTIYAHFNELQTFQDQLLKANQQGKDWSRVIAEALAAKKTGKIPEAYIESFDGKNLALNLCMDSFHFSFSLRDSLFDNAAEYYDRGKKAKQKSDGALDRVGGFKEETR